MDVTSPANENPDQQANIGASRRGFEPLPAGAPERVSWIHIGDLHMAGADEQNAIDLGAIVDEINTMYRGGGVSFVFLPGDIADRGDENAYRAVRSHLDRLQLPWCGIVGDHDVTEQSFANFQRYIDRNLYSGFSVGRYRFLRLNAFSRPHPRDFTVSEEQLAWIEEELRHCEETEQRAVLLLHCYPSDLKEGGSQLSALLRSYPVALVDMGHTHYNELSNDGRVVYSATRSTGQIEEGAVGYSVVTLDHGVVSWQFVRLGAAGVVCVTSPADTRLQTERTPRPPDGPEVDVCVRAWSRSRIGPVTASLNGAPAVQLQPLDGCTWQGRLSRGAVTHGRNTIRVTATLDDGTQPGDAVDVVFGGPQHRSFASVDQDNAVGAWEERGILGTQLGPNKNGRQW